MKKFLIVAVAAAVCVGFSGLAMADLKVGGKICFDTYMQNFSDTYRGKSDAAPDITDFSEIGFENNSSTNLNARWTDGNFGMYLELAMGSSNDQGILQATRGTVQPVDNVYTRYSYGWWDFGAGKLTVGQDNTGFSPLNPMQMCGTGSGQFKIIGIGFGNIYSGRVYQVRGDFKMGESNLGIALVDPHGSSLAQGLYLTISGGAHPVWAYQITPAGNEETTMPRIDISAVLKFGPLSIYPGLLYNEKTWDDVAAGQDDTITTSLYSLGVKYATGSFGVAAEYNAGTNPGDADLLTDGTYFGYGPRPDSPFAPPQLTGVYGTGFDMAAVVDSTGKVSDTDFAGYWVDLSLKFGYNTIHAIYGQQHIENDSVPYRFAAPGTDLQMENTRTVMTFNAWIPLSKHMIVIPELNFWDYGDRQIEGQDDVELGKANIYGISWLLIF